MSDDLVDTQEMYLKAIFELEEEGITPLRARLVERLGQSKPTVSETVARMERDGLLSVNSQRHLVLSDEGRTVATQIMRKHRLAERLLLEVIGMPWAHVHPEACRWEHVMSGELEKHIVKLVGDEGADPFGNPIPRDGSILPHNPAEKGLLSVNAAMEQADSGEVQCYSVARMSEILQTNTELLEQLFEGGFLPGVKVRLLPEESGTPDKGFAALKVESTEKIVKLSPWAGEHIFLEKC